jgi:MAF protein
MTEEPRVILASASPRRQKLLRQIGVDPIIMPSYVDEKTDKTDSIEVVKELSLRKAADIQEKCSDEGYLGKTIIISADTVVSCDGHVLGKPKSQEKAEAMLKMLSGREHEVLTGVTVMLTVNDRLEKTETFVQKTSVKVTELSDEDISDYIATGEPIGKAGSYAIQGIFGKYVEGIEGDYYNVVGLPICALNSVIRGMLK